MSSRVEGTLAKCASRRMYLKYFRSPPWLNRFTRLRRGAAFAEIRQSRPILTSLHLARIMSGVGS